MPLHSQFSLLAQYNQLMNQRQYEAASLLSHQDLNKDYGAFFQSVLGTLNHLMVGDLVWLKRFSTHPSSSQTLEYFSNLEKPKSLHTLIFDDFEQLRKERKRIDELIINWVDGLSEADLQTSLQYNDMAGNPYHKSFGSLIHHLFLHQVHHRGQVTTLLSQFGVGFGETDILEILPESM